MEEINDSIVIKSAETDEELCGRGYVHCTAWQEAYRGIVCDRYLDTMTVEATTARARNFPDNTLVAKDGDKVVGFAVYSPSRDEDLPDAGEVDAIYVLSEYYGRKVGYRLMNEALSRLSEYNTFFVWVFEKNERAIKFYHKYGFEFDGCKKQKTFIADRLRFTVSRNLSNLNRFAGSVSTILTVKMIGYRHRLPRVTNTFKKELVSWQS